MIIFKITFITFSLFIDLFLVCVSLCLCGGMHVEVRGQLVRVSFLLSICGSQGLNLGLQTWQKAPLLLSHVTHLSANNLNNKGIG